MSDPSWGAVPPLTGCEVVRVPDPTNRAPKRASSTRPPVVVKLLALKRFLDGTARELTPAAALVRVTLSRDDRGGIARTAVTNLARRCGFSERTVKRRLAELKSRGLVEVVSPGTRGVGPTEYRRHTTPRTERA